MPPPRPPPSRTRCPPRRPPPEVALRAADRMRRDSECRAGPGAVHELVQGLITTVIGLAYALIPDVSSAYWVFSVITTQVYLMMYLLMFVAAVQLRRKQPDHPRGYRAPMLVSLCGIGFAASLAALLIGFVPPSQFESGNAGLYVAIVAGGALGLGLLVPFIFYRMRKPSWRTAGAEEVPVA